eukprot:3934484-Rhodomonas_salina.1
MRQSSGQAVRAKERGKVGCIKEKGVRGCGGVGRGVLCSWWQRVGSRKRNASAPDPAAPVQPTRRWSRDEETREGKRNEEERRMRGEGRREDRNVESQNVRTKPGAKALGPV